VYIARFIESQKVGACQKIEDSAMPKRMLKGRQYYRRRKGKPRMRWLDDVESD
jgi:hypothetical protein